MENIPNVEIKSGLVIRDLQANAKGELSSIAVEANVEPDESKMTDIQPLEVNALFVTIGREPDNKKFENVVELDETGHIKSDESCTTSTEGVFCAGDTRAKKLNQVVTATADGAVAASGAIEYLNKTK